MRQQRDEVLAAAEIDENGVAHGAGMAAAAVAAVGMDRQHAGGRFEPLRRLDLDRQAIFVAGPVDPDLVADHERRQQRQRAEPFEIHLVLAGPPIRFMHRLAHRTRAASNRRARPLDPGGVLAKDWPAIFCEKEST